MKMARALGFLDGPMHSAIDCMRRIRNAAAHLAHPFSFEDTKYKLDTLAQALSEKEKWYLDALEILYKEAPRPKFLRRIFQLATCSIFYRLNEIADNPAMYATIFRVGGHLRHTGVWDKYHDDLQEAIRPYMEEIAAEKAAAKTASGDGA